MGTPSYDLTTLDTTQVAVQRNVITQALAARFPDYETRRGVLHDVVLELFSMLAAAQEAELDQVRSSSSLAAVDTLSTAALDALAGNYRLSRTAATAATGEVRVLLSRSAAVTLPAGTQFLYGTTTYKTTRTFQAQTASELVVSDGDRLITAEGASWGFTVDVEAAEAGSAANLARYGVLSMPSPPARFVSAYAYTDLAGGADAESNTALTARIQAGWSSRAWGNRASLEALLFEAFPSLVAVSAVGAGAAEMLRDRHGLFPISSGGKVDLYVRTQALYATTTVTVTASLISKVGSVGTWQINLAAATVPGFYEVEKVLLPSMASTATGFAPTADTRNFSLTGDYQPDIAVTLEGVYSAFQTAQVQFADTTTDATALSPGVTAEYRAVVRYQPLIAELQAYLGASERSPLGADVLVKAAVPVFTSVAVTVLWPTGSTAPAAADIQSVLADSVNQSGFTSRLSVAQVAAALRAVWPTITVDTVSFTTRLRKPDGTNVSATVAGNVSLSDDAANMVSGNTLAFYLRDSDVAVTVNYV